MEEPLFSPLEDIPFDEVLTALLDEDQILDPLYLYRLSDISPENLSILSDNWDDINVDRRRALIEDLEHLTDTNNLLTFESVFRIAIKDEDDQVRFFGTRAIEIFDTDDLIPFFISVLEEEENVDVRAVTASVLGKYIYRGELDKINQGIKRQIEDTLFQILESDQPSQIKQRSLEAISFSSRSEVQDHILKAYNSDDEDWIASAVFAMGRSFDHQYSEMVLDQLQHTSPKVRLEAVRASGELVLEDAVPVILDLLDDLSDIRAAAIWALSQIGGEDAGPAIHQLLDDEVSEDDAELIQQALERLDFLEDGVNLSMFDMPFSDDDEYILDDYDYTQDDYDEEDFELDDFELDDDLWLE
ncbi:MAG: HEAT repeat domain-containing protein [Anaerolineales bacterium]|nr:HEAT repeat domain-containing protein [Anaerolineales bacterium]